MKGLVKYTEPNSTVNLLVKDVTSKGIVTLYASAFNNIDSHRDIITQGAYAKTIKEQGPEGKNRIAHLYQHSPWDIIGKPLSMKEDANGLLIESFVSDKSNGDYRKMYAEGLIREHSIMGYPIKEEYDQESQVNHIKEIRLMEYSAVTWGANSNTPTVSVKSMNKDDKTRYIERLLEGSERLSKALRNGTFTDETMYQIEVQHEQLKSALKSLLLEESGSEPAKKKEPKESLVDIFRNLENQKI